MLAKSASMATLLLGIVLSGCPDESSSDENDAAGDVGGNDGGTHGAPDAGGGPTDPNRKVGTFTIRLVPPTPASDGNPASAGYTSISGKVFSGPVPEEVVWDVDVEQGGCKLLKPRVPFCDPGCAQGVCVEDDKCEPNPTGSSAGEVTLTGFKSADGTSAVLRIEPISASYSNPAGVTLAYPPFDEGAELRLNAKGESTKAFEIVSHGIAPLILSTTNFALKSGSPFALAWKAPSKADQTRIQIKLDISHHGGTKGKVVCDVPDNGSLSIAADLITRLLKLGVAGFPTVVIDRVATGSTKTSAGSVDLVIVSELEQPVQIDGLVSCTDSAACGAGKTCQSDLTCK